MLLAQHDWLDRPDRFRLALHVAMKIGLYHPLVKVAWRVVSEDFPAEKTGIFPADCPHLTDCHCLVPRRVPEDTPEFPAYSQVYLRNYNRSFVYSYGRRLPGLRSRASPEG